MTDIPSEDISFNLARYCLHKEDIKVHNKTALVFTHPSGKQDRYSYAEIERMALCFGGWLLARDIKTSARIFLKLKTGPQFVAAFFGALSAGMVPVPLSPLLTQKEVYKFSDLVAPHVIVLDEDDPTRIEQNKNGVHVITSSDIDDILSHQDPGQYADTRQNDPAFMVFTSGTSALPKVVVHAHRVVLGRQPMFEGWTGIGPDDRVLHAGALNWTYSLGAGLLDVCHASATGVFYTGSAHPEDWPDIIAKTQATIFAGVPSLYRRILKYGDMTKMSSSDLRHGLCAGEPMPAPLYQAWLKAANCPLYEALGMSEISTYISSSPKVDVKPGSPGKPQKGRKVAILKEPVAAPVEEVLHGDIGVIAIHGSDPGLLLGYFEDGKLKKPELIDGWFITGDMARADNEGYIWFDGRGDEIMNPSGYRVSPVEVEETLSHAQCCADIAVCEIEAKEGVRIIAGFVVLIPDINEEEARNELEKRSLSLALYKRPREFFFVDALPRTANGKVKRADLVKFASKRPNTT